MADWTFIIPAEYRGSFPNLGPQNQVHVPVFDFENISDQLASAREQIAAATGLPITEIEAFTGGPTDEPRGVNITRATTSTFGLVSPQNRNVGVGPGEGGSYSGTSGYNPYNVNQLPPMNFTIGGAAEPGGLFGGPEISDAELMAQAESNKLTQGIINPVEQTGFSPFLPGFSQPLNPSVTNLPTSIGGSYVNYSEADAEQLLKAKKFAHEDSQKKIREAKELAIDKLGDQFWEALEKTKKEIFLPEVEPKDGPEDNNAIGDSELWETIGADLVDRGEAVDIRELIDNPDQYLSNLPKDQRDVVYEDAAGVSSLNPWLEQAMILAGQQAGYISEQQIQFIESSAMRDIAVHQRESALEVAEAEGESREAIATLETDANTEIARLDRNLRESEFRYLDTKNTLEFNLQQRAQQNEYNLLVRQGKRSESDAVRQHALSIEQVATERETAGLQFKTEQARLESAERERIRIQEAQLAEQASQREQFFEQQRVELEQYTQQTNLQRMQDELTAQVQKEIAQQRTITDVRVADIQKNTAIEAGEKERLIALRQSEEAEAIADLQREAQVTVAGIQASTSLQAAQAQAGGVTGAAALGAEAASPFGYVGAGIDPVDRAQRLTEAQTILGEQFNPYALSGTQFTDMQGLQARAGATPFGAFVTAPATEQQQAQTYGDLLALQQAQAAQGPFQAAQLGQGMGDISTILRGGLTPQQQLALAQAPGNPFGLTAQQQIDLQGTLARGGNTAVQQQTLAESLARGGLSVQDQLALAGMQARGGITDENEFMALQQSLARGGLTPTQRLTEVQAGAAPQNMANYLNFIGNPAAVGFAGQSGFLQNVADSPEGNIPASLFGLNVPQNAPTVPVNPTLGDLTDLSDEQLGFYQGQMAAQNYQTPSQIYQQAQTVTPQGV